VARTTPASSRWFVGACVGLDRDAVDEAITGEPEMLARVLAERGDLVARAAEVRRPAAIWLLVDLGFNLNALQRTNASTKPALVCV